MSEGEAFEKGEARIPERFEKLTMYDQANSKIQAMLLGEREPVLVMSTVVSVLHHTLPHYFWTGFYRVVGDELVVGPYQGTPACLKIAKGRGVCGEAWEKGETMVVKDVNEHPGHIACDARSASEIVVPWKDQNGEVIAVLDVDSTLKQAFDGVDEAGLELILGGL